MTGEQRQAVREARNAQARRRQRLIRLCSGCGCGYDERTPGCDTCLYRHKQRRWKRNLSEPEVVQVDKEAVRWHQRHDHELQTILDEERRLKQRRLARQRQAA